MTLHVAVIATPSKKGSDNKLLPMATENLKFVAETLEKGKGNYGAIYHGVEGEFNQFVDDWAFTTGVRTHQFPAYWFDPTKEGKVDKSAGLTRTEAMLRSLQSNGTIYDKDASARVKNPDVDAVVLIFTSQPIDDSRVTKHAKEKCEKYGLPWKEIPLPVQDTNGSEAPDTSATAVPW